MVNRVPGGTPDGGQFSESRKPAGPDLVFEPPADTKVPQANRLDTVSSVVDAIADGCYSNSDIAKAVGVVDRQGSYYANAAQTLGLVEQVYGMSGQEWRLSPAGASFVGLDAEGRADYISTAINEIEWFNTYLSDGEDTLREEWSTDQDLGDETISRRLTTISAWAEFSTSPLSDRAKKIAEAMMGTRERSPEIVAAAQRRIQARAKNDRKINDRKCPKCRIVVAPSLFECENCGTKVA